MARNLITRMEIRQILGPIDEDRIVAVLDVGATATEVLEAKLLAEADQPPPGHHPEGRTAIVHRIYDILRAGMPEREPRG